MECCACGDESQYFGLTACGHKSVCSTCWFKIKLFSQEPFCPVCRGFSERIFLVTKPDVLYEDLERAIWGDRLPGFSYDPASGLFIEGTAEYTRLLGLNLIKCPICSKNCEKMWNLSKHLETSHSKQMCHLCIAHSIMFLSEHPLYDKNAVRGHLKKVHKECELCMKFCYDDVELMKHLKSDHFYCEFCTSEKRAWFLTEREFFKHLKIEHYVCEYDECRRLDMFLFPNYELLQEHYSVMHSRATVPLGALLSFKTSPNNEFRPNIFDPTTKNYQCPIDSGEDPELSYDDFPSLPEPQSRAQTSNVSNYYKFKPNRKQKKQLDSNDFPELPMSQPTEYKKVTVSKKRAQFPNVPIHPVTFQPMYESKSRNSKRCEPVMKVVEEKKVQEKVIVKSYNTTQAKKFTQEDFPSLLASHPPRQNKGTVKVAEGPSILGNFVVVSKKQKNRKK